MRWAPALVLASCALAKPIWEFPLAARKVNVVQLTESPRALQPLALEGGSS